MYMKSFILAVVLVGSGFGLFAQKLDRAKEYHSSKKLNEAKTEIDNFLAIEKNQKNSEAWFWKTKIYNSIAADSTYRTSVPDARATAFESLKKYAEIESGVKDSTKRYLSLTLDQSRALTDIYSGYSKDGANFYNANNFNDALTNFRASLDVFDFMASKGWTNNIKFDTITTLYAGISADKANKPDEAAIFYGKIAELKLKQEGYIEIYKWLTDHYKRKNDIANATKFIRLGREVYPEDPFWASYELDMLREKATKEELFAKYEEVIAQNPTNHLFPFNYAVELYQAAYDADLAKRPANSKELISKATANLAKSLAIKSDFPNANLVLGQILYNEGVDYLDLNKAIKPAAGAKLTPDQTKKKAELRAEAQKKFDEAIPYFQKVEAALGSQGKLKMEEKRFLKDAYDLLVMIYESKQNADKIKEYSDKFNNVDKVH